MRRHGRENRGFTLMEMLIVVAIIAVLVAIAIPVLNQNLEKARQAADMANARSIQAVLAAMINTGEVTFPEKTDDVYAQGIGIWVLVVRSTSKLPKDYRPAWFGNGNVYCGSEEGVSINGVTTTWGNQNTELQKAIAGMSGISSRSHSSNGQGWDWYIVEYDYDPQTGEMKDYIYSGFANDPSGIQAANRSDTNIAIAMNRKNQIK